MSRLYEYLEQTQLPDAYTELASDAKNYSLEEKAIIKMWGGLLSLVYNHLQNNGKQDNKFEHIAKVYLKADEEKREEIDDYIADGKAIGKNLVDKFLESASKKTKLKNDLIVYRYSEEIPKKGKWYSYTVLRNAPYKGKKNEFKIPKGTSVIYGNDYADKGEIIIKR